MAVGDEWHSFSRTKLLLGDEDEGNANLSCELNQLSSASFTTIDAGDGDECGGVVGERGCGRLCCCSSRSFCCGGGRGRGGCGARDPFVSLACATAAALVRKRRVLSAAPVLLAVRAVGAGGSPQPDSVISTLARF
jgi:hypothetical protein